MSWSRPLRYERGQALPLVAISMLVVLGLSSLAIDVGSWRYQQRRAQTAADSAAMAGAVQLGYSSTLSSITTSAQTDAASNGFTNGSGGTTVTVNQPPLSGAYAGNTQAVEVIVSQPQAVHFGGALLGLSSTTVAARAVALLTSVNRNCIFALDTSSSAITENNTTITMPKCGVISNGGLLFNQGTVNAASVGYAGSSITVNNTVFPGGSPKPAVPAADPCPTISGCAYLSSNPPTTSSCNMQQIFNSNSTQTLSPGRYCTQVIFEGNGPIVFQPGVYDFTQGFIVNSGPPSFTGSGVTIYNQGTIIFDGTPNINLTAPTTGSYAGVVYYQPASDTNQFIINSGAGQVSGGWAGMIYAPGAQIVIDGTLSTWLLVVAKDLLFNSSSSVNDASSNFPGYAHAVLAE